jgi:hypothetical protein
VSCQQDVISYQSLETTAKQTEMAVVYAVQSVTQFHGMHVSDYIAHAQKYHPVDKDSLPRALSEPQYKQNRLRGP